ncbi:MAG: hypothetical protein A3A08_00990 [Candidatus Nealsonbacteria bacterium RIFCSPLOWO2_01_FULL_41_9]|uniref:PilN domain-containing protein n=1 Tax=Candidatus Nealsonbacteria bacterium RIFCSPLOWO2_01_FULL_41_9 TaxID=1801671 RepID=A0A1G2EC82_9BACT|nr:MAG: hypothetical protein A3A08_00990 [Candidatus Nealsonbacteria bacterium RIFCSPLOWO2_01_FULL_41_9]
MVEIIPKTIEKPPLWQDILLYFSVGLFLAAIFSFFSLNNSLKKAEDSLQNLERSLSQERPAEQINLEKKLKTAESQINSFSQIIGFHVYPSKIFDFLPKIIHPKARFKQISLDVAKSEVVISGETENLTSLQQQIFIFQQEPLIVNSTFNSFSAAEKGKIDFNFNLSLSPQIFNQ